MAVFTQIPYQTLVVLPVYWLVVGYSIISPGGLADEVHGNGT